MKARHETKTNVFVTKDRSRLGRDLAKEKAGNWGKHKSPPICHSLRHTQHTNMTRLTPHTTPHIPQHTHTIHNIPHNIQHIQPEEVSSAGGNELDVMSLE